MKKFYHILAAVLFLSILIIPTDDAPLKVYILWAVYDVCALWLVRVIWRHLDEWEPSKQHQSNI